MGDRVHTFLKVFKTIKMNIQLPVFAGFTNYAICCSDDPRMTSCYVIDTGFKTISDYLVSDGTYACLPFVPGHL